MEINNPLVGIVILNWNGALDTIECLKSIESIRYNNYFTLVVDNGSTDNSPFQIRTYVPDILLLQLPKNLGFAAGANEGIKSALRMGARYILLLNNDTIVAYDLLELLVEAIERDRTIGVAIPKIYKFDSPTRIYAAGAQWTSIPPRVKIRGFGQKDKALYDQPCDLDYATGCAMLIRSEVFAKAGMLDPVYFMYQEDYDFCIRVRQLGFRIFYVPQAKVWHKGSRGLGENSASKWFHWTKSTVIFYKKNFSIYALLCFLGWVIVREMVRGNVSFLQPFMQGLREGFGS